MPVPTYKRSNQGFKGNAIRELFSVEKLQTSGDFSVFVIFFGRNFSKVVVTRKKWLKKWNTEWRVYPKLPVFFESLQPVAQKFGTLLFSAANCQSRSSSHRSDAHVSWSWTHEPSPPEPGAPQVTTEPSAQKRSESVTCGLNLLYILQVYLNFRAVTTIKMEGPK